MILFNVMEKIAAPLDAKRSLLSQIKGINPFFYNEFVREFLTDPLTLEGFEKDLVNALYSISGIMLKVDDKNIYVQYKSEDHKFTNYEAALMFAIGLLYINKNNATI